MNSGWKYAASNNSFRLTLMSMKLHVLITENNCKFAIYLFLAVVGEEM